MAKKRKLPQEGHFLRIEEVAERLGVSERTIFRYVREVESKKRLRATKIGFWRITEKDLKDFIERSANTHP